MTTSNLNNTIPWVEKYRPNDLSDIISHQGIISTLTKLITANKLLHMIFYGMPGTGKTSTILAVARKLYGDNFRSMTLELNGSDERGINVVRDQIKDFAATDSKISKIFAITNQGEMLTNIKLVILDEADAMTYDAQFALRRVIEKYTDSTRFCLICNYATKIIPALKSRCQQFIFGPIPYIDHLNKINQIIQLENIQIDSDAIEKIIELSEGDMRKSLNLLQPLHTINSQFTNQTINLNMIYRAIGYPSDIQREQIINCTKLTNLTQIYNILNNITSENNLSNTDIIRELTIYYGSTYIKEYKSKLFKLKNRNRNVQNTQNTHNTQNTQNTQNHTALRFKSIDQNKLINLFNQLGQIEINLSTNANPNLHLLGISSAIYIHGHK